jgi:hypothetical protein
MEYELGFIFTYYKKTIAHQRDPGLSDIIGE